MAEVKNICLEALERHCASGGVGRLDFIRGEYNGQIFVKDSRLVHAQIGVLEGVPALFRLFDWGDAETTWMPGIAADKDTLNLSMDEASQLYAENLQERVEIGTKDRSKLEPLLAPEVVAGQHGIESVLKAYTILLECSDPSLLPEGFVFSDASKSSYVIGSSPECDVILRHGSIDPLHCGMILERGSVMVWDLGAQSGVRINGHQVEQDVLKVGDVMTLGSLDLRVRFQLRRPAIKVKPPAPGSPAAAPATAAAKAGETVKLNPSGTVPMPKLAPSKEIPKGAITYEKVSKQLRARGAKGTPFLNKLASLFGKKDK
jgi:hypothetical protein